MVMDNYRALDRLDAILDDVDEILMSMDLDKDVLHKLTAFSYTLFMEAEHAVSKKELDKQAA
jgi:hypothetical protein